jgi:hypothetical protein
VQLEPSAGRGEKTAGEVVVRDGSVLARASHGVADQRATSQEAEAAGTWAIEESSFGGDLGVLLHDVLRTEGAGVELLLSLRAHVTALDLVWTAHERGVVALPPSVAHAVSLARLQMPSFLTGVRTRQLGARGAANVARDAPERPLDC